MGSNLDENLRIKSSSKLAPKFPIIPPYNLDRKRSHRTSAAEGGGGLEMPC